MGKLTKASMALLKILGEGNPIGLTGIGTIIAAQGLLDAGLAKMWMMNMLIITDAGRRALLTPEPNHDQ